MNNRAPLTRCLRASLLCGLTLAVALGIAGCASPEPQSTALTQPGPSLTVFLIGDSTMSDKPLIPAYPERGWGQMLPMYFKPEVRVSNHARNGRSTKSFMDEGRWTSVLALVKPGDYVVIQFGHNDEKKGDTGRFTEPFGTFKQNLKRYVHESRAAKAVPVLATPVARRKFDQDGRLTDTHGDYCEAVRQVAAEEQAPLLDLEKRSRELLAKMGPEQSKRLFDWVEPGEFEKSPAGLRDDTHFNAFGASRMCDLAVLELRAAVPDLARRLVPTQATAASAPRASTNAASAARIGPAFHEGELIFSLNAKHNHAAGIVECPNGDLLVSWYRGSGERQADDVAVYGARLGRGAQRWSEPFLMVDTPGFPDGNTAMHIDPKGRLWLFWPVVMANTWESCLTQYRVSESYETEGAPRWSWQGTLFLKPRDFERKMTEALEARLKTEGQHPKGLARTEKLDDLRKLIGDKLSSRLGWQVRCKPTVLPSGRILLPLYSDTYSAGLMAISDDEGQTWFASEPLAGYGSIQPAVLRRDDGTLVAYMRENGPLEKIRVSESRDDGLTWGPVGVTDLPNPGSGLDGVRLQNGHWVLVYNDTTSKRNSLAVSLSEDEGRTWKWTRHLEQEPTGSFHYPAVIQAKDGTIHAVYSYYVTGGQTIKHAAFNEDWIRATPPGSSPK
jgi:lysophospholipase L1-like esterase/predicted neuraminidase